MTGLMLSSGSYTKTAPRPGVTIPIGAPISVPVHGFIDICSAQGLFTADWCLRFECSDNLNVIFKSSAIASCAKNGLIICTSSCLAASLHPVLLPPLFHVYRKGFKVIQESRLNWNRSAFISFHAPLWASNSSVPGPLRPFTANIQPQPQRADIPFAA